MSEKHLSSVLHAVEGWPLLKFHKRHCYCDRAETFAVLFACYSTGATVVVAQLRPLLSIWMWTDQPL